MEDRTKPRAKLRNLASIGVALGFTLWRYVDDSLKLNEAYHPLFWMDAREMMHKGDVIHAEFADTHATLVIMDIGEAGMKFSATSYVAK